MDVPKDALAVADVATEHGAEVVSLGPLGTRHCDSDTRRRTMPSKATQLLFGYDAGPWGDWLSRALRKKGDDGWLVAPSRLPKTAGDRVTTDRRGAGPRARLRRSGALTPVSVPQEGDEAMRALTRAREEAMPARKAAHFRLHAVLRRHDRRSTGHANGGPAHRRWRAEVVCHTPAPQLVFQASGRAGNEPTARLQRWEQARHEQGKAWRLPPVVEALQALRGGQCTGAATTGADLGDLTRFDHPRQLMTCLGLLPSADPSAARRRQGAIGKAGQPHARRAVVEGAWAYRSPAKVSRPRQLRLATHPKAMQALSWQAQGRVGTRFRRLVARGQQAHQVVVAMARELVGCMGARAKQIPGTP